MSGDLIRRQDAIDAMYQLEAEDIERYGCSIPEGFDAEPAVEALEALSSAEPERKKGQWIIRYYDDKSYETKEVNYNPFSLSNPCGIAYCSECGAHPLLNGHEEDVYSKYCPNCGCKMDWSDDE